MVNIHTLLEEQRHLNTSSHHLWLTRGSRARKTAFSSPGAPCSNGFLIASICSTKALQDLTSCQSPHCPACEPGQVGTSTTHCLHVSSSGLSCHLYHLIIRELLNDALLFPVTDPKSKWMYLECKSDSPMWYQTSQWANTARHRGDRPCWILG